ncbi:MAG: hypothetical protein GF383_05005 [Candidatus Lokiarchaeota archaeon]|nr:hypothetical protein [Candidatus Lokiarchaeota archaeon]MBD3339236.1 hypothetical protein [Candidatus Lokiarchaeota archaeon]
MTLNQFYAKHGPFASYAYYAFFKRPLIPALAAILYFIFKIPLEIGFSLINSIFYMSTVFLFYSFVKKLGYNILIAFTSALLFSCSFTMLVVGAGCMTDAGAFFISALILRYLIPPIKEYWALKGSNEYLGNRLSLKNYLLAGLITAIGVLIRETAIFNLIAIYLYIFMEDLRNENGNWVKNELKNLSKMIISITISVLPLLIWIVIGLGIRELRSTSRTLLDLFQILTDDHNIVIILIAFNLNYLFFIFGFIKENDKNILKFAFYYFLIMLIPNVMQFFSVPPALFPQYRVIFMLFPFMLVFSALGLHELSNILGNKVYTSNLNRFFWYGALISLYILINFLLGIFYISEFLIDLIYGYL